jgi:2'-5' RNA ligase
MTLLFLGAVPLERVPELATLTDSVATLGAPYGVRADAGGGRLRHGEGVAWLGLSQGAGAVIETAERLAHGCPSDITVGAPAKRTPAAHLTLVRRADTAVIEALRSQIHGPLGVEWDIDDIVVVRSHLEPGGARYETLHRSTLYAAV